MSDKCALLLVGLALLLCCACAAPPAEHAGGAEEAMHGTAITWFEGEVDEAFELARQEQKPLFLYWGAIWCPPCNYLKTTTFRQPEFVAKSRQFVTVYLDGDTERAQIYGEKFDVMGYPTVIIFDPQGSEIMRMPRNVPPERYAELLDSALKRMRPVREILDAVLAANAGEVLADDLNLLAFYAWDQDALVELAGEEQLESFKTLYDLTPEQLAAEKSRFLTLLLEAAAGSAHDSGEAEEVEVAAEPVFTAEERARYNDALLALLADGELRSVNLSYLIYSSRETIALLHPVPSPERDALVEQWKAAARAIEENEDFAVDVRLSSIFPSIWLANPLQPAVEPSAEEDSPELPAELLDRVRERVAWAAETVSDEGELQAVVSTMGYLLEEAGLAGEAEALLQEKMHDTAAPYYFMSWIAGMKKEAEQNDEALVWYRKAYESAEGRYTRFRWGSIYLRQVMELAPEDVEKIENGSFEIIGELLTLDDAFALGNHMRLDQLDAAYVDWNEAGQHDELLGRIRTLVHAACDRYPAGTEDSQQSRCATFLSEEES